MISIRRGPGHKLKEWSRRYLPAEVLGSCAAVTAAWMVQIVSGSPIGAAIVGTLGESLAGLLRLHHPAGPASTPQPAAPASQPVADRDQGGPGPAG